MNLFSKPEMQTQIDKAFSVAAAIPAAHLMALQTQFYQLLETGASFHEGKKVLRRPIVDLRKNPEESA